MYDSRSSHPRNRGSRYDRNRWTEPKRPVLDQEQDITDGLLVHLDETSVTTEPVHITQRHIDLDLHPEALTINQNYDYGVRWEQPLAEWEWIITDGEGTCKSYESYIEDCDYHQFRFEEYEEEEDDYEPGDLAICEVWMPVLTLHQACQELDGFTVEGPSRRLEPLKAENYVRVHELANKIGWTSAALIRHLRLEGEYVTNHMSMVALPIANVVIRNYGLAPEPEMDPLAQLRERLLGIRRPAPRPGAPRSGINPFHEIRRYA